MDLHQASALSVSCGDGIWDYLALTSDTGVSRIIATDVVTCPVDRTDIRQLQSKGIWNFVQVKPGQPLPFENDSFDLCFSMDVIEHTRRPYLFLSEQFRLLRGGILVGTPNILRPANILRACMGKLHFPMVIGRNDEIGDYVHQQEFHEEQLVMMLEEVGFIDIVIHALYFGLSMLNRSFCDYPEKGTGRTFAHFLLATATKP